jgi:hypothetical protein
MFDEVVNRQAWQIKVNGIFGEVLGRRTLLL